MPPQNKPTFVKLKPRNPKPSESPQLEPTTEPITETAKATKHNEYTYPTAPLTSSPTTQKNTTPDDSIAIFQAVGILTGDVHFADNGQATLTIGKKEYALFYTPSFRTAFDALFKEVAATGKTKQKLIVYPKIIHFPSKEKPHQIAFQLVAFDKGESKNGIYEFLMDKEFQLRGLWQFIPVCRTPCITVMKNFSKERLDYIKKIDLARKIKFLKSSHIPIFWKDAPIKPFRFNPKAGIEQGHPAFVQIKAKFIPQKNTFAFVEQLAPPSENAPQFLKASKDDKTSLQKSFLSRNR